MNEYILIVDDERDLSHSCQRFLNNKGYRTQTADNGKTALDTFADQVPDLVITDLKMPTMDGMELLRQIKATYPEVQIVMITAFSTIEDAVEAMKLGAADFVPKPFTPDHLSIVVERVLGARSLREENRNLRQQLSQQYSFDNIIGTSAAMVGIFESIKKISDTQINVLITGASGTGKELIARSIHANSSRKAKPFVPINCGALPEHLVEGEIFGYEKGAFTGAARPKPGLLEEAHGGTFFLDEIGDLPLPLQVKFLRVLEDGKLRRLGSNVEREVDFRLICATHCNLAERVETEQFREDLFYRLNTFTIEIPPLQKRPDDIPLIANHYLAHYAEKNQKDVDRISPQAMALLQSQKWKGNVRELEHVIERAVILASAEVIEPEDLPQPMQQVPSGVSPHPNFYLDMPFKEAKEHIIEDFEQRYIRQVLEQYEGNISHAATHSGIDRRSLHRLLAKYQIKATEIAHNGKV